jgi:hypothetical protein
MKEIAFHPEVQNFVPSTINVTVALNANQAKYEISDSLLENKNVIGLFVRRYGNNRKSVNNRILADESAYQCCFISIKKGTTTIIDRTPLEMFMGDMVQSYVPIDFPAPMGIRNKEIVLDFSDISTVDANTDLELIFIVDNNCQ